MTSCTLVTKCYAQMAAITIGTNGAFVPTTAQTYGVYIAVLLAHGLIAGIAVKYIARLQPLIITLNMLCVRLPSMGAFPTLSCSR